jgi:hypothetical protein
MNSVAVTAPRITSMSREDFCSTIAVAMPCRHGGGGRGREVLGEPPTGPTGSGNAVWNQLLNPDRVYSVDRRKPRQKPPDRSGHVIVTSQSASRDKMMDMTRPARVVTWNGKDVPAELRELPAGRYVVEAVDEEAPSLSPDEEAGIEAALESYRQGRVVDAKRARQIIDAALGR